MPGKDLAGIDVHAQTETDMTQHSTPPADTPKADPDGSASAGRHERPTDAERPVRGEFIEGEGTPPKPGPVKIANETRGGEGDEDATSQ